MNRVESVAMKVGTCSQVTRSPLTRPIASPSARQTASANQAEVSCRPGAYRIENTAALSPMVEPTERSRSLLISTKVMPTAITPNCAASRRTACRAEVWPQNLGLIQMPAR